MWSVEIKHEKVGIADFVKKTQVKELKIIFDKALDRKSEMLF